MKKHFIVFVLLLGCMCGFAGCKSKNKITTLATPTNLIVQNNVIKFDEVKNASYYIVNYNNNTFTVLPSKTGEVVYDARRIFTEIKTQWKWNLFFKQNQNEKRIKKWFNFIWMNISSSKTT